MKIKTSYTAALAALGLITQAHGAANVVYMTGSTAFRGNVNTLLATSGAVFDATPDITYYGNATSSKATYVLFHGNINSSETYISCFWTGSEAGIACVAGNTTTTLNDGAPLAGVPATFLAPSETANPPGNSGAGLPSGSELNSSPTQADIAFADTSQAVSLTKPIGNNALTSEGIIGIVPFIWEKGQVNKSDGAWTRFVNLSHTQINELLANGTRTADFINAASPGGSADFDHTVYLFGRNKGSGTRANELLDAGYSINAPVVQYQANSTVGANPASGLYGLYYVGTGAYAIAPIPNVSDGNTDVSDNGYESGGDVQKALVQANAPATGYKPSFAGNDGNSALTVGMLGLSDAGVPSSGSIGAQSGSTTPQYLTLDGEVESDGAIESGTYTAWGHEHVYAQHTISNPEVAVVVPKLFQQLKTQLENNDSVTGNGDNLKADPSTLHSTGILGFYMFADRSGQADSGFPVSGLASSVYTKDNTTTQ